MKTFNVTSVFDAGVLRIEFVHEKANCLSIDLVASLRNTLATYVGDKDLKVIYLKPIGSVFSAGANLADYRSFSDVDGIANYLTKIGLLLADILYAPCVTLTRIDGKAVGGGVGLLSVFDYVVSSHSSSLRLSELSLGIAPLVISPFLILKMGIAKFYELSFSGLWKDATWAYNNGLVAELVEPNQIDLIIEKRIEHFYSSGLTSVRDLKQKVLPEKSEFLKTVKENSILNAPFVFEAIKNKKI